MESRKYKSVRGLARGLAVLEALNTSARDYATSGELSKLTGLHRTTVRRLLETLIEDGYIVRSNSDDSFRLTRKVRQLSEGFTARDPLSSLAMPIMGELMQKVVWPSCLCVPDGDAMRICESNHRFSPLSFHRGKTAMRIPFLATSAGRSYFAFSDSQEQARILHSAQNADGQEAHLANDPVFVATMLRTVRSNGYSTNFSEWEEEKKVGAIAMPIFDKYRVIGSLNIIFLAPAIEPAKAITSFVDPLQHAVDKISNLLQQSGDP